MTDERQASNADKSGQRSALVADQMQHLAGRVTAAGSPAGETLAALGPHGHEARVPLKTSTPPSGGGSQAGRSAMRTLNVGCERHVPAPPAEPFSPERDLRGYVRRLRPYFQKGLVACLRRTELSTGLQLVRGAIARIQTLSENTASAALWSDMGSLAEAVCDGHLELDREITGMFGRIDRLLKALVTDGPAAFEEPPPDLIPAIARCLARVQAGVMTEHAAGESDSAPSDAAPLESWEDGSFFGPDLAAMQQEIERLAGGDEAAQPARDAADPPGQQAFPEFLTRSLHDIRERLLRMDEAPGLSGEANMPVGESP